MNLTAVPAIGAHGNGTIDDDRSALVVGAGESGCVRAAPNARQRALSPILVTRRLADRSACDASLKMLRDAPSAGHEALAAIRVWKNEFR